MAFSANQITLAGLAKIELPPRTLYLCDGGMVIWGSETYFGEDAQFGTIGALDPVREGLGDMAPGNQISLNPPQASAAALLSQPGYQNSRMRFWLAEVNRATGQVIGTPELAFDGLLDTTVLKLKMGSRSVDIDFVSRAERLFLVNEGNVCTTRFHQRIWPGETGFDGANGLQLTVAWGVEGPPRGTAAAGGFGGGYGGGIGGGIGGGGLSGRGLNLEYV